VQVIGRRRISAILLAALCSAVAPPLHAQTLAPSEAAAKDVQSLAATLNDDAAPQAKRDEAARRLVSRQSPEARAILQNTLIDVGNRGGQLAVARALATDPQPDPSFITPLNALLGPDKNLTEAAAAALANFKASPELLGLLTNFATATSKFEPSRIAVIKALGTLADKRAAATLVEILQNETETQMIRNAAADALADMTGLRQNGRDVQRWLQWWEGAKGQSDAQWRESMLNNRATRYDQLQQRHAQLTDEVENILTDQYETSIDSRKPERLMRYLTSPQPEIRMIGARIIYNDTIENRTIPPVARAQLRQMVGDSSPEVRLEVARAIKETNDAAALEPLLTQLAQETDPDVRAALAAALANIQDMQSVGPLVKMLDDPNYHAAESAATALKSLGPMIREKDPVLAKQVADKLRQTLETRATGPGTAGLREACVDALVPLRDPASLQTFYRLLRSRDTIGVRRAALKALGALANPDSADVIVSALETAENDPGVRLEAITALGNIKTFEHAETLMRHMDPAIEPDASVRQKSWDVFQKLLPLAKEEQLALWADRFTDQPDRRLAVLKALETKLVASGNVDSLGTVRQQIGEVLLRKLNDAKSAVPYLRAALQYWRTRPGPPNAMVTEALVNSLMEALLTSGEYADARVFASEVITESRQNQETVGPKIRAEAERLRDAGDLQSALALLNEAEKINPPLDPLYRDPLKLIEEDVRKKLSEKNAGATTPQSAINRGGAPCGYALRYAAA
jgi:HEAT repeat protein